MTKFGATKEKLPIAEGAAFLRSDCIAESVAATASDVRTSNLDGQAMGRKGQETYERLLAVTTDLFGTVPLRELRAAEVARKAGISPAAFYLYFENVEAIALVLADRAGDAAEGLVALAESEWMPDDGNGTILQFVEAFFKLWDEHRPILRVRNLAAEEGEEKFLAARLRISTPLHFALAGKIARSIEAGRRDIDDLHQLTLASVALAAIERNAATYPSFPARFGVSRTRLIEASVFMLRTLILGAN